MEPPLQILFIEDKPADFQIVERHLQKHGLDVKCHGVTKEDELEAALEKGAWNLVLSDYNVPLLAFEKILSLLRSRLNELPLILVSGSLGEERAVELLKQGVWDFVLKENLTRLVPAIERCLRDAADRRARQDAEAALRESELRRSLAMEAADMGVWDWNMATGKIYWSGTHERLWGYAPGEFPGTLEGFRSRIHPEDLARSDAAGNEALRSHAPYQCEYRVIWPDGSVHWVASHGRLIHNPAGQPVRMVGVVFEITERKQVEAALRQSEEQFRAIFENASVGMVKANPQTRQFEHINRKMCEITGYTAAELLQMKVPEITHPSDRQTDGDLFQRLIKGEMPSYQREKRYVRKDHKTVWVNVNVTVIRDAAGQPICTVGMVEDITARRAGEEERMRLSTALEQAAESIVITDLAGTILYVNPAFEKITGYSRREAIGQNPRILSSGQHDLGFFKKMWAMLEAGKVWHGHFVNKRKDGTLYEEEASISPVRDTSGKIVNYMAINLDVSREMELERQFRQSQKVEAIGQLAGGVAHDFNNILTSILMQVELASMEDALSDDLREGLQQIRNDADRAASLTRQLLLFSRRQVMQSRDLDLNEIVTHLAKMLQRIIGEDVRLQLNLHPAPLITHADAGMLDQVAMNLAVNARDAMPEGGRLLIETSEQMVDEKLARQQPDAAVGRYVCLSVRDTGCGIPADVLPRIFEPFFTTKEAGKGTGLGLATVFGIVKQHRGWLTVDSEPGQGTTFKAYLPSLAATAATATPEARPKALGGTETILLVEDDASVRRATLLLLKLRGYKVLEAANGRDALRVWAEHRDRIAMLFTDLVMPGGMSGRQLAQALQAGKPALKIIFASGYSAEIAGQEIRLRAGENFIQKPFQPDDMLRIIRDCLDG